MISLEHATKKYGHTVALRDVSLEAARGRITGLLGRNGAGKTTALNLMTGYFPPDEGRVLVDGMDLQLHPRECRRRIGYLPEKPPLYDEMTVSAYLKFVCDLREVLPRETDRHVDEILGICALEDVKDRVIGHLSKGYRQRVGIAQALCGNPEALILDEPTVGLDPMQVVEIRELIRTLGHDHTILLSSHILSEVQQLCDAALILHEGRLIRSFDMNDMAKGESLRLRIRILGREKELLPAVRSIACIRKAEVLPVTEQGVTELRIIGKERDERGLLTDQLFHLLAAMDAPIRQMTTERDDLEAVFLEATAQ
ncbi:MAG: ABC transporter ATP-binding protein [Clostridiales bacterium]|nr:ABC transporter ATP-binding protein [Clostridiales bacterium]